MGDSAKLDSAVVALLLSDLSLKTPEKPLLKLIFAKKYSEVRNALH